MFRYSVFMFIFLTALLPILAWAQDVDPEKLFLEGSHLIIEEHCGDCYKRTREGTEEGIAKIIEALDAGYEDKATAYKILAEAFKVIAVIYAVPDSEEQDQLFVKYREALLQILSLDPNETDVRYHYASSFRDEEKRTAEYREILKIDPDHFLARYSIGMSLIEEYTQGVHMNNPQDPSFLEKGIEETSMAIANANNYQLDLAKSRLIPTLHAAGLTEQEELIAQRIETRANELEITAEGSGQNPG